MGGVLASRGSGGGECVLVRLSVTPTARHSMCWTDLTSEKVSDVLRDLGSGFGGLCCRLTDLSSGATDFWSVLDTAGESADQLSAAHPGVKKGQSWDRTESQETSTDGGNTATDDIHPEGQKCPHFSLF